MVHLSPLFNNYLLFNSCWDTEEPHKQTAPTEGRLQWQWGSRWNSLSPFPLWLASVEKGRKRWFLTHFPSSLHLPLSSCGTFCFWSSHNSPRGISGQAAWGRGKVRADSFWRYCQQTRTALCLCAEVSTGFSIVSIIVANELWCYRCPFSFVLLLRCSCSAVNLPSPQRVQYGICESLATPSPPFAFLFAQHILQLPLQINEPGQKR